ncbi:MAG: hypothetical protein ACOYN0_06380 [Phycisphaerales bacterium]
MSQLSYDQAMKGLNRALELARAANKTESQEDTIEDVLDRVFVSPRIVDQSAYEDWAARLRQLMAEMSGHQKTAAGAAAEFRSLESKVKDAAKSLQQKMETAIKIVPTIDQRLTRAEEAITAAGREVVTTLERLEGVKNRQLEIDRGRLESLVAELAAASVEKLLGDRAGAINAMIDARIQDAGAKLEHMSAGVEDRAGKAQARAAQLMSKQLGQLDRSRDAALADIEARLKDSASELARASDSGLAAVREAGAAAIDRIDALRDSGAAHVTQAAAKAGTRLGEQIKADAAALETLSETTVTRLTTLRDETAQTLTRAASAFSSLTAEAKDSLRITAKAAGERVLADIAALADAREMGIAQTARRAEHAVVEAEHRAEEARLALAQQGLKSQELATAAPEAIAAARDGAIIGLSSAAADLKKELELRTAAAVSANDEAARHASVVARGAIAGAEQAAARALSELSHSKSLALGEIHAATTSAGSTLATAATESLGALSDARDQARAAIAGAAETATAQMSSAIARAAGKLSDDLSAEAAALAEGARVCGTELRAIKDETSQSLTRAAREVSSLISEARETIRSSADAAIGRARSEAEQFTAAERESLERVAGELGTKIASACAGAEQTGERVESAAARAAACLERTEQASRELEATTAMSLADTRRSLDIMLGGMDERVRAAGAKIDGVLARVEAFDAGAAEHAAAGAESATAKALSSASLLNGALSRAEELKTQVERTLRDLTEMRRQADYARRVLAETVLREAERIDAISKQLSKLKTPE